MHSPITPTDAVTRFPELRELVALRERQWNFHLLQDEAGKLVGVAGTHSRAQYTDVVFVFDRTHIVAARLVTEDHGGGIVWFTDGDNLHDVVGELLDLPAPGEPGAPSLIIKSSALWTP